MQSLRFFVTGLPRSRTAWLAKFFTTGDIYCMHEGLNLYPDMTSLGNAMSGDKRLYGNSDSALCLTDFQEVFKAPTLIIERDRGEVLASLDNVFGTKDNLSTRMIVIHLIDLMISKLRDLDGLRIPFNEIDTRLEEIWQHCIGDGYDPVRGNAMSMLNIQTDEIWGNPESARKVLSCLG